MRSHLFLSALLLFQAAILTAGAAAPLSARGALVKPSQDPFYIPPSGFASAASGAILRERKIDLPGRGGQLGTGYQLLYRTNNALGEPLATVTTVLRPYRLAAGPPKISAIAAAIDSASIDCAPSYILRQQWTLDAVQNPTTPPVEDGLSQGWIVTVPDHQGPDGTFLVGQASGKAMLDGIRATLSHRPSLPDPQGAVIAVQGFSGGGVAAAWTAKLFPSDGAGLPIAGVAAGGFPIDVEESLRSVNGSYASTLVGLGLVGIGSAYPELQNWYDKVLTPEGKTVFEDLRRTCLVEAVFKYGSKDFLKLLDVPDPLSDPTVVKYFQLSSLNSPSNDTPIKGLPLFVLASEKDEIVPYKRTFDWYQSQCSRGARIRLVTTKLFAHSLTGSLSVKAYSKWAKQVFDGTFKQQGCSQEPALRWSF